MGIGKFLTDIPGMSKKLPIIRNFFEDEAGNKLQGAFEATPGQWDQLGGDMDARRKAALMQAWGQYDPVNSIISKMYGPGAVGPGLDIDALFGPSVPGPAQTNNPMTPQRRELQRGTGSYWDPARDELANQRRNTVNRNLERSELNKNSDFKRGTRIKR